MKFKSPAKKWKANAKRSVARTTGIPTTKSGRSRKVSRLTHGIVSGRKRSRAGSTSGGQGNPAIVVIGLIAGVGVGYIFGWIAGIVAFFVAAIATAVALTKPTHCGVCDATIKKTSYTWEVDGEETIVCPNCNRRLEQKKSKEAVERIVNPEPQG